MKYTDKELFSKIKTYSQLAKLLRVSESQANRLWRGICPLSEAQSELLSIKLGMHKEWHRVKSLVQLSDYGRHSGNIPSTVRRFCDEYLRQPMRTLDHGYTEVRTPTAKVVTAYRKWLLDNDYFDDSASDDELAACIVVKMRSRLKGFDDLFMPNIDGSDMINVKLNEEVSPYIDHFIHNEVKYYLGDVWRVTHDRCDEVIIEFYSQPALIIKDENEELHNVLKRLLDAYKCEGVVL